MPAGGGGKAELGFHNPFEHLCARSLAPLEKTRGFGMTQQRGRTRITGVRCPKKCGMQFSEPAAWAV